MKMNATEQLRKCQLLMLVTCAVLPLPLILLESKYPVLMAESWVFPAVFFLLVNICIRIPGKARMGLSTAICLLGLAGCFLAYQGSSRIFSLLIGVYYCVILFVCLPIGGWGPTQEITVFWMAFGMCAHLAAQLALYTDSISETPDMDCVKVLLVGSLFLFVLLTMLSQNRKSLTSASGKRQRASVSMRRKNTLMTVLLFLVAITVSFVPSAMLLLKDGFIWLWNVIKGIVALFSKESAEGEVANVPSQDNPMAMMGEGETGALAALLEKLIVPLGMLLALAAIGYGVWRLAKLLRRLFLRLWKIWSGFAAGASEDYVDEIISTRDPLDPERLNRKRTKRRLSQSQLRAMPPAERIRYRYRKLRDKNPSWQPGSTARETISVDAASIYERARYSDHPVSDVDDQRFAQILDAK